MESQKKWSREYLPFIYLVIALFALRYSLVEPYVVPTPSMEPTLKKGDRLYALKCAYDLRFPFTDWVLFKFKPVKKGDVILFRAPHEPDKIYVKRAVAVAGDTIQVVDGSLIVNEQPVPMEPWPERSVMYDIDNRDDKSLFVENENVKHYSILDNRRPNDRNFGPVVVPTGKVFAMGDNRDQSFDSRGWGFVPEENLKGQAMFIWFSSWDWKVRTERIGTVVQ
ncbi:signal peptidase I [bacterium]|nr:signal peptidase I [bacterium]